MTNSAVTGGEPGQASEPQAEAGVPGQALPGQAQPQAQAQATQPQAGQQHSHQHHVLRRTRVGGVWVAVALFAIVLLLLLIFILQNGHQVEISFFGGHGHLPLGVALLLTAVLGVLLVVIPGTGRIIQLRLTARRHRRIDATAVSGTSPGTEVSTTPGAEVGSGLDASDPPDRAPMPG